MKKIMNLAEDYVDDVLRGIYMVHGQRVTHVLNDLRCYHVTEPVTGKVAIVTGGGSGHLPLFLGYVGENMLDGCAVGGVFQSPSAMQIVEVSKAVNSGKGILFLYGNYTGDILNFDMAAEILELEGIKTRTVLGADDVNSADKEHIENRRGVAGIFFLYKCASAKAAQRASLDEVVRIAEKAKANTRTVGFAFTSCTIPEVGKPTFSIAENEMAMGMGIHGEPGIWNGPILTASEIVNESLAIILNDMPLSKEEEVSVLINGLGATSLEELYILCSEVLLQLGQRGISVKYTYVGEYATSLEMAGASISFLKMDDELDLLMAFPAKTPFWNNL